MDGTLVQRNRYSAYGVTTQELAEERPDAKLVKNRFGFTGRELDDETGLHYYRARYYSAELGRFISSDPIGFNSGTSNIYSYSGLDPVNSFDPWGTNTRDIEQAIIYVQQQLGASLTADIVIGNVDGMGKFDADTNTITISGRNFDNSRLPLMDQHAKRLLETVYHEALHSFESSTEREVSFYQDLFESIFGSHPDGHGAMHASVRKKAQEFASKHFDAYNTMRRAPRSFSKHSVSECPN